MYEERVEELCRNGCRGLKEWAESNGREEKRIAVLTQSYQLDITRNTVRA